jgi:hypothetical protein
MATDPVSKVASGNEEEYFRRLERERLEERARAARRSGELEALAGALGLHPADAVPVFELGITAETAPAFEALPLIEVAWADGAVDEEERWRVLEAATRLGVELGRPAHALLEGWLERPPACELYTAWHRMARSAPADRPLRLEGAESVAGAAGGVLGFAMVSRAERRALDGIRASLSGAA